MAALKTRFFFRGKFNKELFKDPPLTQVGLFTVTLDPRPSWPQLLLPNMKSFPFSGEKHGRVIRLWLSLTAAKLSFSNKSFLSKQVFVLFHIVSNLLLRPYARPRRRFSTGRHSSARIYWERCRQICSCQK